MKFRNLTADEIDCRVSTVTEKGCSLLLYKDARCDMRILDETIGSEKWQRSHEVINDNLFCNVSILCETGWVTKQDVGTESYTEKEKGEASDSFKRACFNWGIGRELYTAPFIWITADKCDIKPKGTGFTTFDRFKCTYIRTEDGKIVALNIENAKTHKTVYTFGQIETEQSEPLTVPCEVCKKAVGKALADREMKQHGHVYCSAECHQKIDEIKG